MTETDRAVQRAIGLRRSILVPPRQLRLVAFQQDSVEAVDIVFTGKRMRIVFDLHHICEDAIGIAATGFIWVHDSPCADLPECICVPVIRRDQHIRAGLVSKFQ